MKSRSLHRHRIDDLAFQATRESIPSSHRLDLCEQDINVIRSWKGDITYSMHLSIPLFPKDFLDGADACHLSRRPSGWNRHVAQQFPFFLPTRLPKHRYYSRKEILH
jgi:hypothetical protein